MFKVVGISVAVDNALEDIKKLATYVTNQIRIMEFPWFRFEVCGIKEDL